MVSIQPHYFVARKTNAELTRQKEPERRVIALIMAFIAQRLRFGFEIRLATPPKRRQHKP